MNKINIYNYFKIFKKRKTLRKPSVEYLKHKEQARRLITSRLTSLNAFYNYKYNRIFIKNQKTRWGSCSKKGNLNFSYKIIFLPTQLINYIVVHELCHLGEFNHSGEFWNLVGQTIPDYKKIKIDLKTNGAKYAKEKKVDNTF